MSTQLMAALLPLADDGWHHDGWGHGDGGWWVLMLIAMILFWLFVAGAIYWLARGGVAKIGAARHGPGARQILDRRFAEGEIEIEEYERRRAALDGETRPSGSGEPGSS